jgi:hypothetical protein
LFSIWAILSCRPTPAPAVLFKLCSSDAPDSARALRTGSSVGNPVHRGWHLAADRGRLTRWWLSIEFHLPVKWGYRTSSSQYPSGRVQLYPQQD